MKDLLVKSITAEVCINVNVKVFDLFWYSSLFDKNARLSNLPIRFVVYLVCLAGMEVMAWGFHTFKYYLVIELNL